MENIESYGSYPWHRIKGTDHQSNIIERWIFGTFVLLDIYRK